MKLGILSDTHDQAAAIQAALRLLKAAGVDVIIHCGDITAPDTIRLFAGYPMHFVLGNCDWHVDRLRYALAESGAQLHEPFGDLALEGKRIAWVHGHESHRLEALIQSQEYDLVCHGHTHVAAQRHVGRTLVLNPGALQRVAIRTCAVYDLATGLVTSIDCS